LYFSVVKNNLSQKDYKNYTHEKTIIHYLLVDVGASGFFSKKEKGWVSLFDGKSFAGWRVNEENPKTFSIEDGTIKVAGERTHLFYEGLLVIMISKILN
jgi:hypothetical protein